jgi:DICT domain-containing protein
MRTRTATKQAPTDIDESRWLTIGELGRRTGLTPEVLRMWESRHAFPEPARLPSGHRRYREEDVGAVSRVLRLRDAGVRLDQAIAQVLHADNTVTAGSVYAALRHRHPGLASYTLTKRTLLALSWAIEDESVALARRPLLVGAFQAGKFFQPSADRWRELARVADSAYVFADFPATDDTASPALVAVPADSPLLREWIVLCDGPGLTAVLVAWEVPGQDHVNDFDRLYEAVWSLEPDVVRDASRTALAIATRSGSAQAAVGVAELAGAPLPAPTSQQVATAVFNRMVAYTDGTVLRSRRAR